MMRPLPRCWCRALLVTIVLLFWRNDAPASDQLGLDDPLVAALVRHDYPSAKRLLAGGYPVGGRSPLAQAPAFWVIARNDARGLRLLIGFGLAVDHEWGKAQGNLLTNAVQFGNLKQVRLLCEAGAVVQRDSRFGRSPLYASVIYDHPEVERYLRARGARYNGWDIAAFKVLKMEPK